MKLKRHSKFLSFLMVSSILCLPGKIYGLGSGTHQYVTKTSIDKIEKLSKTLNEKNALNNKENSVLCDIDEYKDILITYSLKPDEDENQGSTFKHHFYNPVTGRNFLGEEKGALSKCEEHYGACLELYKEGNKEKAFEEFGRAIHFLEDANTPVHTGYVYPSDAVFKLSKHVQFENVCDLINKNCDAQISVENLDYYRINDLKTIVKASAVLALDNFYRLEEIETSNEEELAKNSILNAQKNVVGMLYKFIGDAGK